VYKLNHRAVCAYCGVGLNDDFYRWLLIHVDHVVPAGEAKKRGIPRDWYEDKANRVLCCSGCNLQDNRFPVPEQWVTPATWEEFVTFRDKIFAERRRRTAASLAREFEFFISNWKSPR